MNRHTQTRSTAKKTDEMMNRPERAFALQSVVMGLAIIGERKKRNKNKQGSKMKVKQVTKIKYRIFKLKMSDSDSGDGRCGRRDGVE